MIKKTSETVPESVKFYAKLSSGCIGEVPVAIDAFHGVTMHLEGLIEVLSEIREPNVLTFVEKDRVNMMWAFEASLRRLWRDMEVIRDYSVESLASDPWVVQKIMAQNAAEKAQTVQ